MSQSSEKPPTRRDRKTWVFNSADTFSGNPKWLFLYVNRFRPDIEAWWITSSRSTVEHVVRLGYRATSFDSADGRAVQYRAGVWAVNQVKEEIPSPLKGVVLLNLWHGVGVKSIERGMSEGYLRERIARKYIRNNQTYHDTQLFLVTSPAMEEHFSTYIGLSDERIVRAGYPQNLYPRLYGTANTEQPDLRAANGLPAGVKVAVYAPTPRREDNAAFLHRALPDVDRLLGVLRQQDTVLVLKMHPHLTADPAFVRLRERYGDDPHLLFWDNSVDIYEYFEQVDLAIVDYSSILYDMLNAGITRVIRYIFDFDGGQNAVLQPGTDYLKMSCGAVAHSFDELLARLAEDNEVPPAELAWLDDYFWEYSHDDSMETIVNHALDFEPVHTPLPTLYSFDVFDTLIGRRVVQPNGIFFYVGQRMQLQSEHDFPEHLTRHFATVRGEVESHLREARRKRPELLAKADLEITFEDIYRRIADLYDLTEQQRTQLAEWELEAELDNCEPCPAQVARVRRLVESAETVVLMSDQYLPKSFLRQLLAKADPLLADVPLYLSNDQHAQKTTLELYLKVYEDLDYDFARWVHTGDNSFADVRQARRLGIKPVKVPTPRLKGFGARLARGLGSYDGFQVAGLLRSRRLGEAVSDKQMFSYRNVSLYLVPYLDWVLDDAVRRGYRTLYFVSRDGYHMKRIAEALIEERGLDIRTRYLYGSRRAWRLASQSDDIDDNTFSTFGSFAGVRSVEELAETADLPLETLLELVPEVASYTRFQQLSVGQVRTLLVNLCAAPRFRSHLATKARQDHEIVVEYLRREMDLGELFAVVEYWGRGYTQDCLVRLLGSVAGQAVLTPFYYARSIYLTEGEAVRHNFTSASRSLIFMEAVFANLPHGTVEGYRRSDGEIVPVTSPRDHDQELRVALETELPRFAVDFARMRLLDSDRCRRELFEFAVRDFQEHPDLPLYVDAIGHLKDAVSLGAEEREFAPALSPNDFVDHMRGKPLARMTGSVPISIARSGRLAKRLFEWRLKYDLPRWVPAEERNGSTPGPWRRDRPPRPRRTLWNRW